MEQVEEEAHAALNCGTEQAVLRGTFFIECDDPTLQACPPLTAFASRRASDVPIAHQTRPSDRAAGAAPPHVELRFEKRSRNAP